MNLKTRCFVTHLLLFFSGLAFAKCFDPELGHGLFMVTLAFAIVYLFWGIVLAVHGYESQVSSIVKIKVLKQEQHGQGSVLHESLVEEADAPNMVGGDPNHGQNKRRYSRARRGRILIVKFPTPPESSSMKN